MNDQQRLGQLLDAHHACISINTFEEESALDLLRNVAIERGCDLWQWSVTSGIRDGLLAEAVCVTDTQHPAAAMYYLGKNCHRGAMYVAVDVAGHLKDERTLRSLREAIAMCSASHSHLVLLDHSAELPPVIRAVATPFTISLPDEEELEALIRQTLRAANEEHRIEVNVTRHGLDTILRNLSGLTRRQAKQIVLDTISEDRRFDENDINTILARKRRAIGGDGLLEYIQAPIDLSEIGGLNRLKSWLKHRENALSDDATKFGLPAPRGVLMLGVQGAGKSLSAKAIATAWKRPLLRLDPSVLFDRYIGESERNLRDALRQAEMMAPVILWIDEIEKGFASAASQSTDGGLSKRMFGTILTWMQEHTAPVFTIATANDIEALPPELLRKGRFDEIFFVDLPDLNARRTIFSIHIKKRGREIDEFDFDALAAASDGFSGAEIEQAVISALHEAYAASGELSTSRVLRSLEASPPLSVTMAEKVGELREWAKGRCVPAD